VSNSGGSPNGIWVDGLCIASGLIVSIYLPKFAEDMYGKSGLNFIAYGVLGMALLSTAYLWWQKRKNIEFGRISYGFAMFLYGVLMGVFFVTR
jgi:hypothetical protein